MKIYKQQELGFAVTIAESSKTIRLKTKDRLFVTLVVLLLHYFQFKKEKHILKLYNAISC